MEEKQERCRRCHGGYLLPTLNPNEFKCNYCGWQGLKWIYVNMLCAKVK